MFMGNGLEKVGGVKKENRKLEAILRTVEALTVRGEKETEAIGGGNVSEGGIPSL